MTLLHSMPAEPMPRPMRVLDLFAGLGGWSAAFTDHEVTTVDFDPVFDSTITADVLELDPGDLGPFDVVLASPPCEGFSVASIGHHWTPPPEHAPKTDVARMAVRIVAKTLELIEGTGARYWWMENPRGKLRKLPVIAHLDSRVTVTYCQYGESYMKPTDLWGVWPPTWQPRSACKAGEPCHDSAPRGAKTGLQGLATAAERAVVPYELSHDVLLALEGL